MNTRQYLQLCKPPYFVECAIFQSMTCIFLLWYISLLDNKSKEILQPATLITFVGKINLDFIGQEKSIVNITKMGNNNNGISFAEWYVDDGDGVLSQNEQELPHKYTYCISTITIGSSCELPNDIKFNVLDHLGEGTSGTVWKVAVFATNDPIPGPIGKDYYAMKFSNKWRRCGANQIEWRTLFLLYENDINMPYVHPTIPFYWFNTSCLTFIRLIDNSWMLWDLYSIYIAPSKFFDKYPNITKDTLIDSFIKVDGGLLDFFMKCHREILKVIEKLYDALGLIYNDLHHGNILIDKVTHHCYLIDFGSLFVRQMTMGQSRGQNVFHHAQKYKCERSSCSPFVYYHLKSHKTRNSFRLKHGNMTDIEAADVLMEHAMNGLRYNLFSKLLHVFVNFYAQKRYPKLYKMNSELSVHCTDPSKLNLEAALCRRFQIIELLKTQTDDMHNSTNDLTLKLEFWKFLNMYENDKLFVECKHANQNSGMKLQCG